MDGHIKAVVCSLWQEIRKDLPFFGICGFAVGWLMIAQFRLKEIGVAPKESWADTLFSDFISFNAFGFVFIGLLGLGSLITCLHALKLNWPKLEKSAVHLEARLAQLASSIISFTIGLSLFSSAHALFTITAQGVALSFLIALFDCLIVVGFMSAALVARRPPPFDRWYVGLGMFTVALVAVICFVLYGTT